MVTVRSFRRVVFLAAALVLCAAVLRCGIYTDAGQPTNLSNWLLGLALSAGSPGGTALVPGLPVDLDGNGTPDGRATDTNGDGVADGVDLNGDGTPEFVLIDTNGDGQPDAVDQNGDGAPDYYLCIQAGKITLKTASGCTGNDATLIDSDADGVADGVDTDGDGTSNDTTLGQIATDAVIPTIAVDVPAGTYGPALNVTLTCSDNIAPGTIGYSVNASAPDFAGPTGTFANPPSVTVLIGAAGDGTYTLRAICRDAKGNISALLTAAYVRDSNVPSITVTTAPASFISASGGAINATAIEWRSNFNGPYDVRRNSTTCGGGTSIASGTATANVDVTTNINAASHFGGEGAQSFTICATNVGNGLTGAHVFQVTRDDTAPVVTPSPATGNYSSVQSVALACADSGAGCDKIAYTQAVGSTPADPTITGTTGAIGTGTQYSTALSAGDDAVTTVKSRARDNAGNVSAVVTRTYTIASGVSNITINTTTTPVSGGAATVDWESSRAGTYVVRIGGADCSTGSAAAGTNVSGSVVAGGSVSSTINNGSLAAGSNTIRVCVQNVLGNFGSSTTSVVKDTTIPTTSVDSPTTAGPHASGTTLSVSCDDGGGSGCKRIAYSTDGSTPSFSGGAACTVSGGTQYTGTPTLPNGAYTIRGASCDNAGNVSSVATFAVTVGPPSAPTSVAAVPGNGQAIVTFGAISGATSYRVYYANSAGVSTAASFVGGTSSPITVTGLSNGTTYYFVVTASHSGGESAVSSEVSAQSGLALFVFASNSTTKIDASIGGIGGLAGADALCNADGSKPNTGSYKALLFGNAGVIQPYWSYKNPSGQALFTADASGNRPASLSNPVGCSVAPLEVWTGAAGNDCDGWASSGSGTGAAGRCDQSGTTWWANTSGVACRGLAGSIRRIYCVEQP